MPPFAASLFLNRISRAKMQNLLAPKLTAVCMFPWDVESRMKRAFIYNELMVLELQNSNIFGLFACRQYFIPCIVVVRVLEQAAVTYELEKEDYKIQPELVCMLHVPMYLIPRVFGA